MPPISRVFRSIYSLFEMTREIMILRTALPVNDDNTEAITFYHSRASSFISIRYIMIAEGGRARSNDL